MKSNRFFIFIALIRKFCQNVMGSRNPLLKINGFLGTQEPMLTRPLSDTESAAERKVRYRQQGAVLNDGTVIRLRREVSTSEEDDDETANQIESSEPESEAEEDTAEPEPEPEPEVSKDVLLQAKIQYQRQIFFW